MNTNIRKATFAGGCFWCLQPIFDQTKGIIETFVGYTGGHQENPSYEDVCSGESGHTEGIQITFDSAQVNYEQLLEIFWYNIDPTAVNAQFVDHGTQYRSAIFYHDEEQRRLAEESKDELEESCRFDEPIATEILLAVTFYPAEEYHQKYYQKRTAHYKMYHDNSGREEFIQEHWSK